MVSRHDPGASSQAAVASTAIPPECLHRIAFQECIMAFTPVVLIHLGAALGALAFGALTLGLKKGTYLHRLFGRLWVVLMLIAALVSFGIQRTGHFSWIHLLSLGVLVALFFSVRAAMRRKIRLHRMGMSMTYAGLVIAGAFALLPERRLGAIVWHAAGLI
jgi:uncharacterized membrane protein